MSVGNITITDGKTGLEHTCEMCLACLHWCPVEAIQLNVLRGTKGRGRYRHPELKLQDMIDQQRVGYKPGCLTGDFLENESMAGNNRALFRTKL
jgi:Fe-S-cluster-containing hydrogenase component 2